MDEDFSKRNQQVIDSSNEMDMFVQKREDSDDVETATASEVYKDVESTIKEEECELDNYEQLQMKSENEPIKEEPFEFVNCNDGYSTWKQCYVKVTRLKQSTTDKCIEKPEIDNQDKCKSCTKEYVCMCGKLIKVHLDDVLVDVQPDANPHECESCGKCFTSSSNLTRHLLVHTGDKPYQCKECGKCFAERSKLTIHHRIHTGIKPYRCEQCGKCFTTSGNLTRHILVHTDEKPYQCKECGKRFITRDNLTAHIRLHTGERPYQCKECGRFFANGSHLTQHLRTHTGVKPYICEHCGKSFSTNTHLTRHIRIHTGEKPYKCEQCGRFFANGDNLNKHRRSHTRIKQN